MSQNGGPCCRLRPDPASTPGHDSSLQPVVDRLHFASTKEWRKRPFAGETRAEVASLRRSLKAGAYDTVLDLQGAVRSAVIARMAGSRRVIGEAEPREGVARWFFNERVATHGAHVIEQDIELASAVAGDDLAAVAPCCRSIRSLRNGPSDLLLPSGDQRSALINPGAGWGAKRWPVDRYAAVAQGLLQRGFRVLVNGGPGEEPLLESISQANRSGAVTLLTGNLSSSSPSRAALASPSPAIPGRSISPALLAGPWSASTVPPIPAATAHSAPGSECCAALKAAAITPATKHPKPACSPLLPEDVLKAADELLVRGARPMTNPAAQLRPWTGMPAGSVLPAAFACRSAFVTAALYLFELWRHAPRPAAIALSLLLVLPGLWLRGYAAGYVKKNRELTQTGPYAHTRNPLYLGSMLMAAGFAVALLSWPVAAGS